MQLEDVETITVLGAGSMGHGIAEVAALAGFDVVLRDIEEDLVQDGYESVEWSLNKLAEKDKLTEDEASAALDRVRPLVDLEEAVGDADVIVEAVPERMDVKADVYGDVEQHAPDRAVFATNTSSLSITDLAEQTDRPEQFCGMHFFNPPVRMDLVEVVGSEHASEETLDLIEDVAREMDKTPVRVRKDTPGFVVNRVLVPLLNEAAWLVHEDEATVDEVDSTTKYDLGLPMGAFELADQVGIDVAVDVLDYMNDVLGDAYEPAPVLTEKVEAEAFGKKTGEGFYDYEDGGADVPADEGRDDVAEWLLAVMANEVGKLVEIDAADPGQIDEAVMLGAGFPQGPATIADDHGLDDLVDALEERYEATDAARYEPSEGLREAAADGGFHDETEAETEAEFDAIRVDRLEDGITQVTLDRPHRMNTVSEGLLEDLDAALDLVEGDEDTRLVLLRGAGEDAFSAGADVQSMTGAADPLDAVELSRKGQQTFGRFADLDVLVVAAIDGYCLGGGMEMAAAADLRVASERSEFGQPEHDLGLLPGWGGTQRLSRVVGESRATEIIFTAERFDAEEMEQFGFVNRLYGIQEFEDAALEFARDLAQGPPISQKYTKRAMVTGRESPEAGLEAESLAFGQLMNTDDLMEGISAFMGDREPDFSGE